MKFVKLLTVPAVLLISVALAVPASAHGLNEATISVACQTSTGQVCVTLKGDIPAEGNQARNVTFELFAQGSSTVLDDITFHLPASNGKTIQQFSKTLCFKAISSGATGFIVKVVKVTDSEGVLSDLMIQLDDETIDFDKDHQPATQVGSTGKCATAPQQTPTPTGGAGAGTPTAATATTIVALAQTGGFDFRFPLLGLVLLVAGGALFVVSASRGRSAGTK